MRYAINDEKDPDFEYYILYSRNRCASKEYQGEKLAVLATRNGEIAVLATRNGELAMTTTVKSKIVLFVDITGLFQMVNLRGMDASPWGEPGGGGP